MFSHSIADAARGSLLPHTHRKGEVEEGYRGGGEGSGPREGGSGRGAVQSDGQCAQ